MLSRYAPSRLAHVRPLCRPLSSSARRPPPPPRAYLHTVDHLGQVFLADTKIRNFTSNIKEASFLDFFYKRLRPNEGDAFGPDAATLRAEGYSFVSPCGPEMNFVRPDITPLVFQKLTAEGLTYAGTMVEPFDPSALCVNVKSGYVYHPSPKRQPRRAGADNAPSPYGAYSLIRSSLVLEHFAPTLEYGDEGDEASFEWRGKRYAIRTV